MPEQTLAINKFFYRMIWVWMACSSIVLIEPSPHDILFVFCLTTALLFSYLKFVEHLLLPSMLLGLFILSNLFSLFFISGNILEAIRFLFITLYLILAWFFFVGLLERSRQALDVIFSGYIVAAFIAVLVGILAFTNIIPGSELFLYFGRVAGTFKDANVYGPFLVPAVLYGLWKFESKKGFVCVTWLLVTVFLTIGVLLSFSRAAWGNYLISLVLFYILSPLSGWKSRSIKILFLLLLVTISILIILSFSQVDDIFVQRLGLKNYDNDRFGTQIASLMIALENPWGIGPFQTEQHLNYSTHSLYIRVLTEYGVVGFLSFLWFILLTMARSMIQNYAPSNNYPYTTIAAASLVGVLFNSFFIDTLHWRHFWMLLALPWVSIKVLPEVTEQQK